MNFFDLRFMFSLDNLNEYARYSEPADVATAVGRRFRKTDSQVLGPRARGFHALAMACFDAIW